MMDSFDESVLEELAKAENDLLAADEALRVSELRRAIALATYAKLHDLAKARLDKSPYSLSREEWPHLNNPSAGKFRFAKMKIGDAALDVLYQFGPLRLEQLAQKLQEGGVRVTSERELHAALMNKKGVVKNGDKVSLAQEEATP